MFQFFFPSCSFNICLFFCIITSVIFNFIFCNLIISFCRKKNMVDEIRDLKLEHQENKNVPSFGGVAIILSTFLSTILFANLKNIYIQLLLISMLLIGGIGLYDDYLKIFKKSKKGIKPIFKLLIQGFLGILICFNMIKNEKISIKIPQNYKIVSLQEDSEKIITKIPFFKKKVLNYNTNKILGWFAFVIYIFFLTFIISGTSNAVNLTDGVDGLALKNSILVLFFLIFLSFICGNNFLSSFTNSLYISGISQSVIFSASLLFSCLTCLWFNAFPAKIFIGDSGSLMLGGIISILAIFLRIELFLPILCGLFFIETITVILQVFYFKFTKKKYGEGKKLFLLSPLHYHCIKKGCLEVNTVARLTILSIFLIVLTIFSLF